MQQTTGRAKYARVWRGRTSSVNAAAYERYWLANGVKPLQAKGALKFEMFREDREDESEFVTISYWPSLEAMGAGPDPSRTHHLPRDPEFLIELPDHVQILTLLASHEGVGE
jgi:heme-degrading monooxygenase HmoA